MKITKTQLRQIIKEEVMKEFGGAYGGRAYSDSPYKGAQSSRAWDKKNQQRRDAAKAAAAPGKKAAREEATAIVDQELTKAFPNIRLKSTAVQHANYPALFVDWVLSQARGSDEQAIRTAAKDFFSGKIRGDKSDMFDQRKFSGFDMLGRLNDANAK